MELHDHPLERRVLGLLADESGLDVNATRLALDQCRLAPSDFHLPFHADLFAAASALLRDGHPVEPFGVKARAPKLKADEVTKLLLTHGQVVALPHLAGHATQLRALAVRRRAVAAAEAAKALALTPDTDVDDLLSAGAKAWASLTHQGVAVRTGAEHTLELVDDLHAAQLGKTVQCIRTGIDVWDQVLGGVMAGELTFIGSQPGVGKSSVLATIIDNLCRAGVVTGLFSLEDLGRWLPRRLIARDAGVPLFVLAKRPLTNDQMHRAGEAAERVYDRLQRLLIDERSMLTADAVVQTARDMILNRGAKVIIIDHLGKMDHQAHRSHRHDLAYEETLNKLTALAKDCKVPVLIAAHLKGRGEDEKFKRPGPTDFAQTAFIERDARAAVGLYLDKQDPDSLLVAVLKQTNGAADDAFSLRRIKEAGMVASKNGKLSGLSYEADEQRLMNETEAA